MWNWRGGHAPPLIQFKRTVRESSGESAVSDMQAKAESLRCYGSGDEKQINFYRLDRTGRLLARLRTSSDAIAASASSGCSWAMSSL